MAKPGVGAGGLFLLWGSQSIDWGHRGMTFWLVRRLLVVGTAWSVAAGKAVFISSGDARVGDKLFWPYGRRRRLP